MKKTLIIFVLTMLSTNSIFANSFATAIASIPTYQTNSAQKKPKKDEKHDDLVYLRVVTRGNTASVVTASTVRLLLGGGTVYGFKKEELKGNEIKDIQDKSKLINPSKNIAINLHQFRVEMMDRYPELSNNKELTGVQIKEAFPYWSLVYDSSDKNIKKAYVLNFGSLMETWSRKSDLNWSEKCVYKSEPFSLDQWKENDYALVMEYRSKIIEQCTEIYINKIKSTISKVIEDSDLKDENTEEERI